MLRVSAGAPARTARDCPRPRIARAARSTAHRRSRCRCGGLPGSRVARRASVAARGAAGRLGRTGPCPSMSRRSRTRPRRVPGRLPAARRQASRAGSGAPSARLRAPAFPARGAQRQPARAHQLQTVDGLDRADEQRRRPAGSFGDDVQAVIHPVDKVHVGETGRPEHGSIACRPPEAGVGRPVVLADVRLELDDPARPPASGVVSDQPCAEKRAGRLERRSGEERAIDDGQR